MTHQSLPRIKKPKNESIETLRGLAIVLVVVGHVIGIDALGGMKVEDDSIWRYLYASLKYVRMPLFTAISGWVYALHAVHIGEFGRFISKKARRLLLPMCCVGTLYFLVQYFTPGTNYAGELTDIWKIYVLPYTVYWYLPSLFLIFAFVGLVDARSSCNKLRSWGGWLVLSWGLVLIEPALSSRIPNVFGIWGAVCLLPFFLLGVGIKRFPQLSSPKMKKIYLVGFVVGIALQQLVWFMGWEREFIRSWFMHIPLGLLSSAFLLTLTWRSRFLIWLGGFAYTIYLFHAFGASGGRIMLMHAGINSDLAVFVVSTVLGLGVPIVVEITLRYFPLLQTLFLGKKLKRRAK